LKLYGFDNSGLSNPHVTMPEDVPAFGPMWASVIDCIQAGKIAVTTEIYDEMCHITGDVGDCIRANKAAMLLEVDDPSWNGAIYIQHFNRMRKDHAEWIAEYTMKSPAKTICIPDLSAIALAKTLGLPLVAMESSAAGSLKHKRIPDICDLENVISYSFNDFIRIEGPK